jgi:hypothetical protein
VSACLRVVRDPRLKLEPEVRTSVYPYVALRGPTYRENSHANHTWQWHSHETACSLVPEVPSPWVRFPSPAPLSGDARPGLQDSGQDIDPMGKSWESTPRGRRSRVMRCPYIAPAFTRTVTLHRPDRPGRPPETPRRPRRCLRRAPACRARCPPR